MEEVLPRAGIAKRPSSSLIPGAKNDTKKIPNDFNSKEKGYPITFQHLGKRGYTVPLFAGSIVSRRKWIEHIEAQQTVLRERSNIFTRTMLCDQFFNAGNRVSCLVPIGKLRNRRRQYCKNPAKSYQMVVGSWYMVRRTVYTYPTGSQRTDLHQYQRRLSRSTRSSR